MRIIFTCLLFFCCSEMLMAQKDIPGCGLLPAYNPPATKITGVNLATELSKGYFGCGVVRAKPHPNVVLTCKPVVATEMPLFVIDGKPADSSGIKALDPSTIETIEILKDASAAQLFSCRSPGTVAIITTKKKYTHVTVVDANGKAAIGGATIKLTAVDAPDKINMTTTEAEGKAVIKASAGNYDVEISSVGFVTRKLRWNADSIRDKTIIVPMKNQFVQMNNVTVIGYPSRYKREIIGCGGGSLVKKSITAAGDQSKHTIVSSSIFPNPLLRGQSATIDINAAKDESMRVRMLTLTGQQVLAFPAAAKEGANRFNIAAENKLAAGMYLVQVMDHKGNLIQTHKLIIQ